MLIQLQGYSQQPASVDWLVMDEKLELLIDGELLLVLMRSKAELGVNAAMPRGKIVLSKSESIPNKANPK